MSRIRKDELCRPFLSHVVKNSIYLEFRVIYGWRNEKYEESFQSARLKYFAYFQRRESNFLWNTRFSRPGHQSELRMYFFLAHRNSAIQHICDNEQICYIYKSNRFQVGVQFE